MPIGRTIPDPVGEINAMELAERWWIPMIRGVVAVLFGVLAFGSPGITFLLLLMFFGSYAVIDGLANLVMAFRGRRAGRRWGSLVFEGLVSIAAGVAAFALPGMTALVLLFVVAAWAVLRGAAEIAAAIRLRKQIEGEWLLGLSGVLSVAFGVFMFFFPGAGALAVVWWIAAYAVAFGVLLMAFSLRLRRWKRGHEDELPTGGAPRPA
jgi:uncharacterized membrane protein HdeD (DUF308 family)